MKRVLTISVPAPPRSASSAFILRLVWRAAGPRGGGRYDIHNKWRVNIFIFLAGVTTAMAHDRARETAWEMLKKFVPPLLPLFWLGWAIEMPVLYEPCASFNNAIAATLNFFLLFGGDFGIKLMSHCWCVFARALMAVVMKHS